MNYYAEALVDQARTSLGHDVITGLAENKVAFVSRAVLAQAFAAD